jgi:hypothetical protein
MKWSHLRERKVGMKGRKETNRKRNKRDKRRNYVRSKETKNRKKGRER